MADDAEVEALRCEVMELRRQVADQQAVINAVAGSQREAENIRALGEAGKLLDQMTRETRQRTERARQTRFWTGLVLFLLAPLAFISYWLLIGLAMAVLAVLAWISRRRR